MFLPSIESTAQEFRVETHVFSGDSTLPVSENITLYDGYMVYDFQMAMDKSNVPAEIVIFDSRQKSFVLLDLNRKYRTDIHQVTLVKMVEQLKLSAEVNEDATPLLKPEFSNANYDIESGELTISNNDIAYVAETTSPKDLSVMPLYYQAMDQFTRLSASDPHRLPPFARIALNQEIKRHGVFPAAVSVTIQPGVVSTNEIRARSRHIPVWELADKDRELIAQAKRHWMQFEKVTLMEYRGIRVADKGKGE